MPKLVRVLAVLLCVCKLYGEPNGHDPVAWLAQARSAMGGAVAQEAVTSFTLKGTLHRHLGGRVVEFMWEASWEAPDKFVQTETQSFVMGPMGSRSTTRRTGFNGDRGLEQMVSDLPMPQMPPNDPDRLVPIYKQFLARLIFPLLASVPAVSALSPHTIVETNAALLAAPGTAVVTLEGPEHAQWRLALDPVTRLPAMVTWIDHQIMTFSTTSTVAVPRSGRGLPGESVPPPMPALPSGPPPKVEYQMAVTDYRTDKGLTWPRELTITMGGSAWEEFHISDSTVNPKLNPRMFEIKR